ncbi:MAG: M48 family metallopeptidase [Clostridiales bacterium]|nr:M48 family metallopeptidase [Clostridiales bacterium]
MVNPDLIVRTHRRSLSITITKEGKLVIHAPKKLKLSEIMKYVSEKEKWIRTKQKEIENKLNINKDVISYKEILFLGNKYKVTKINGLKKIELSDTQLALPSKIEDKEIVPKIKRWYISNAKKILADRLEFFGQMMQIDYGKLTITNSKTRWGSCDKDRNIKLNFRLVMLPHNAVDYVIVHELTHIVEFNHSKDFYKIISLVQPSYKLQQRILKEYDYVLSLYR